MHVVLQVFAWYVMIEGSNLLDTTLDKLSTGCDPGAPLDERMHNGHWIDIRCSFFYVMHHVPARESDNRVRITVILPGHLDRD